MNVPEAVAEIQKLSNEMNTAATKAGMASTRYEAHLSLYNVACLQNDMKEIETQRLAVISQIESLLDASYELHSRRGRIAEIQRTVSD